MDEDGEGEAGIPNIKDIKFKIFEMNNPKGIEKLKKKAEKKIEKTKQDIAKMFEKEIDAFIEQKSLELPRRTYIG